MFLPLEHPSHREHYESCLQSSLASGTQWCMFLFWAMTPLQKLPVFLLNGKPLIESLHGHIYEISSNTDDHLSVLGMKLDGNSRSLQLRLERTPCLYCQPPCLSAPPKLAHWTPVSHHGQQWGYSSPARLTRSAIRGFMLPRAQIWHDTAGLRKTRWWLVCQSWWDLNDVLR